LVPCLSHGATKNKKSIALSSIEFKYKTLMGAIKGNHMASKATN
jgi:hypothetical protein